MARVDYRLVAQQLGLDVGHVRATAGDLGGFSSTEDAMRYFRDADQAIARLVETARHMPQESVPVNAEFQPGGKSLVVGSNKRSTRGASDRAHNRDIEQYVLKKIESER